MEQLIAFSVILIVVCYGVQQMRVSYWREKVAIADAAYDDLMNRALRAERDEAAVKDEMLRWQAMLQSIQSRPIIATLSEHQAGDLISAVQVFLSSNLAGPN